MCVCFFWWLFGNFFGAENARGGGGILDSIFVVWRGRGKGERREGIEDTLGGNRMMHKRRVGVIERGCAREKKERAEKRESGST